MSVTIPTRQELFQEIENQVETDLNIQLPESTKSALRAFALVQAAKLHLYWQATALVLKNTFPDTADPEAIGGTLERWGRGFLGRNPFSAVQGVYTVQLFGVIGAEIAANTVFRADDSSNAPGQNFILDTAKTLIATTDTITLRALEGGVDSRLNIGDTLTATSPLLNVTDTVTVTVQTTTPAAEETTAAYRAALLRAIRLEPQGGAATDYRLWANDAQDIRFVYP